MEDNAMTSEKSWMPGATRRDAMALISGAVAGVALAGEARAQGAPKRGGILRISAPTNPSSLDPATGGAGSDHAFLFTMYDTLTEWDFETLKAKPGLAESWSFTDPTTLVLNIRPGVTFHDGTPLDAEAVKFNLERNKSDPKSNIKADLASIPELTTGVRSVTAGQNDLIYQLPPRQKAIVERSNNLKVVNGPTLYVFQIFLNWAKPPFDDVRVRKAFNLAIDRESFVKAALAGLAEPAYMNLPKSHWAYDRSVADLNPYDSDRARKLLVEAGFKEGTVIELGGYPDQDSVQRQEILIEQLRKAGIGIRFVNAPVAEASAAFFGPEKRGSGLLAAWTGRPDPSLTYSLMFTKDAYYNGGRAPVPPELEAAIKESRASEDIEIRRKAFAVVQRLVMENAFVVPLAFQYELVAMNKRVQGYRPNLLGKPKYDDVWLEN